MVNQLNPHLNMGQLGSKSPNLQSQQQQQQLQSSMANNMGMNSMQMSIANNGTQQQPMNSMPGKL